MAAIVWVNVLGYAPELSSVDIAVQTDVLSYVNNLLDVSMLDGETGYKTKMARIYLAAHMASSVGTGTAGTGGAVTSESAGGLSRSYSVTPSSDGSLGLTTYGQHYLNIIKNSLARVGFNV